MKKTVRKTGCFSRFTSYSVISWRKLNVHVEEFETLRHIRNAYVHAASDLAKINDTNGLSHVQGFYGKLSSRKVLGIKGQKLDPYFSIKRTIVELKGNTIRRARSLYLQVMMAAGKVKPCLCRTVKCPKCSGTLTV